VVGPVGWSGGRTGRVVGWSGGRAKKRAKKVTEGVYKQGVSDYYRGMNMSILSSLPVHIVDELEDLGSPLELDGRVVVPLSDSRTLVVRSDLSWEIWVEEGACDDETYMVDSGPTIDDDSVEYVRSTWTD